ESCASPIVAQLGKKRMSSHMPTDASLQKILERPAAGLTEAAITDPLSVSALAVAFHGQFSQVDAVIMHQGIFKSAVDSLDFAAASLVCQHYGVAPHKVS